MKPSCNVIRKDPTRSVHYPKLRIVAALAVLTVLGGAGCDKLGLGDDNPAAPTDPTAQQIQYAALGASDVSGVGSSSLCLFLGDCPDGKGYVFVAAKTLRARGSTVTVTNLGIPTAVISRRFQTLGSQYGHFTAGNFIDAEAPLVPAAATLVTIFAGANDGNVITAALGGGAGGSDPNAYIDQQVRAFGDDYAMLLAAVRSRAASARIVVLNVPNLAGLPSLAGASLAQKQAAQRIAVRMTTTIINPMTTQNVRVIDLMCDPRLYQASNLSSDGFHPNDSGYAILADHVVRAATDTTFTNPQASCPQMALIP